MQNFKFLFFIALLSFISCTKDEICQDINLNNHNIFDLQEYEILEAVIDSIYGKSEFLHISQNSHSISGPEYFDYPIERGYIQNRMQLIDDYSNLNASSYLWGNLFNEETIISLISNEKLDCIANSSQNFWQSYYAKYDKSNGIIEFGRPFINENQEALIVHNKSCGYVCGYGYISFLKKENNKWKIIENALIWIS